MTDYENVDEMSFEKSIDALEGLVKRLEDGGIDLDESLRIYEQAVALRDHCKRILEDGERRIKKIMETADGTVREEGFDLD